MNLNRLYIYIYIGVALSYWMLILALRGGSWKKPMPKLRRSKPQRRRRRRSSKRSHAGENFSAFDSTRWAGGMGIVEAGVCGGSLTKDKGGEQMIEAN